ncbi:MAG: hypothetical protein IIZ45_00145 [Firmicutes bacterium]|nr:hypothetical protein [Bacillota bacterium]
MKVKQFVMAYSAEHQRIKAILPAGYRSLRPVLRLNLEIITAADGGEKLRIEFNTPVAARNKRGWLNLRAWETPATPIHYQLEDRCAGEKTPGHEGAVKGLTTAFETPFLQIAFTGVGIRGGCPAESDNDGCFYREGLTTSFVPAETIDGRKEYCDCEFRWTQPLMEAMTIPGEKILGAYQVEFRRD